MRGRDGTYVVFELELITVDLLVVQVIFQVGELLLRGLKR